MVDRARHPFRGSWGYAWLCWLGLAWVGTALAQDPFAVAVNLSAQSSAEMRLTVSFSVPPQHSLYADALNISLADGALLDPISIPSPAQQRDSFSGMLQDVYTNDVRFIYRLALPIDFPLTLQVAYQGCDATACFLPVIEHFVLTGERAAGAAPAAPSSVQPAPAAAPPWRSAVAGFRITARQAGYLEPEKFLRFLDTAAADKPPADDFLQALFLKQSWWAWLAVGLIILGGLSLNLTPCVLPMIPVNMAIIFGAGAQAGQRGRGFALGALYGLAMALAYGALGLVVVLTGAKFGTLNSMPLFNAVIALIFLALALAMFDVLALDFSRWQGRLAPARGQGWATVFVMGAVTALLAGSCVSPVLVSVLLLAAELFQRGVWLGIGLPFLLGLGMGLPWPLLGAGLPFLPRPGKWMLLIKRGFGIIILGLALYYGWQAYRLWTARARPPIERASAEQSAGWYLSLSEALAAAQQHQQPVLVDFWASWCRNCQAMEATFRDPRVARRLEGYIKVKYRAEQLDDPETRLALDYFGALGLPTYVVLQPGALP